MEPSTTPRVPVKYFSRNRLVAVGGIVFFAVAALLYVTWLTQYTSPRTSEYKTGVLQLEKVAVSVEIADTDEMRALGLSGRTSLSGNNGMWFVFEAPGRHAFWMKDMNFPIDIVWLSDAYEIVTIKRNATPQSFPESFISDADARYVLEVPAGFVDKWDISVGERGIFQ